MKRSAIYIFLVFVLVGNALAQQKYWVQFSENTAPDSLEYTFYSKWLDLYVCEQAILDKYNAHVLEKTPVNWMKSYQNSFFHDTSLYDYSYGLRQMNVEVLYKQNYRGQGVKVGIIDAGFANADKEHALRYLFDKNHVFYRVNDSEQKAAFFDEKHPADVHGTKVWQKIAGVKGKELLGVATEAVFYLAVSEDNTQESRIEEYEWIKALEWMHEQGVRLVNSSLGYADKFDNPAENYTIEQMDGNSSIISKAAKIAVEEKGMIIVNAMGNEGNKSWKYLVAPADVEHVISVGAVQEQKMKPPYSSIGLENSEIVKPDVSAFAERGTSYSAPYITGLIAQMLSFNADFTVKEVKEILAKSGHLYPYPNNFVGYGVPNANRILTVFRGENVLYDTLSITVKKKFKIEVPLGLREIVLYNKTNKTAVCNQECVVFEDKLPKHIQQKKGNKVYFRKSSKKVNYTTLVLEDKVIEINWK